MIFTKKQLLDWNLPHDGDEEAGVKVVSDRIVDSHRWSIVHELIFQVKDKFYRTDYSCGSTEYQDEHPWETDELVDCEEVHQIEKTIKMWEAVKPS